MERDTMLALAARVEAAAGADDMLNAEIAVATTPGMIEDGGYVGFTGRGDMRPPPAYTASLDAAATLVPTTALWIRQDEWRIDIQRSITASILIRGEPSNTSHVGIAATPALALTAAALRARAEEARDGS